MLHLAAELHRWQPIQSPPPTHPPPAPQSTFIRQQKALIAAQWARLLTKENISTHISY